MADKEKEPAVSKDRENSGVEPVPARLDFFEWLERQFDGVGNFPEQIHVCGVSGDKNERLAAVPVKQIVFPPKMDKPPRDKIVAMSNEIIFEIQNDCNAFGKPKRYGVHLKHFSRDSAFYARFMIKAVPDASNESGSEEGEEGGSIEKRFGLQILDHKERMFEMYGGATSGLLEHYREALNASSIEISKLRTENADLREQLERALSLREEREERRQWSALKVRAGERTLDVGLALLPPLVNKMLGAKVLESKDSPEALTLRPYFQDVEEGGVLSKDQRDLLFGKYSDKSPFDLVVPGVLSKEQAELLCQISLCQVSPDALDRLLPPDGDLAISMDQLSAISTSCGLTMMQLAPLQMLIDERMKKKAARQTPAAAAN